MAEQRSDLQLVTDKLTPFMTGKDSSQNRFHNLISAVMKGNVSYDDFYTYYTGNLNQGLKGIREDVNKLDYAGRTPLHFVFAESIGPGWNLRGTRCNEDVETGNKLLALLWPEMSPQSKYDLSLSSRLCTKFKYPSDVGARLESGKKTEIMDLILSLHNKAKVTDVTSAINTKLSTLPPAEAKDLINTITHSRSTALMYIFKKPSTFFWWNKVHKCPTFISSDGRTINEDVKNLISTMLSYGADPYARDSDNNSMSDYASICSESIEKDLIAFLNTVKAQKPVVGGYRKSRKSRKSRRKTRKTRQSRRH
jgi:hypothetical protein